MEQQSKKIDYEMVNFIREQRHDFLNYFQVILGYLQLNKPDRAVQYIKQVTGEMQELSSVTKIENPYLVLALLLAFQKGKSSGVNLSFNVESGSSLTPDFCGQIITDQIISIIEISFQVLGIQGGADGQMEIGLKRIDDQMMMVINGVTPSAVKDLKKEIERSLEENPLTGGSFGIERSADEIRVVFSVT